jgi:hypothetical protein
LGGQLLSIFIGPSFKRLFGDSNTMLGGLSDEEEVPGTQVGRYVPAAATGGGADNEVSDLDEVAETQESEVLLTPPASDGAVLDTAQKRCSGPLANDVAPRALTYVKGIAEQVRTFPIIHVIAQTSHPSIPTSHAESPSTNVEEDKGKQLQHG